MWDLLAVLIRQFVVMIAVSFLEDTSAESF